MFERFGIFGMKDIEVPILAGLVTGEPVLLIGGHGTAKTTLCRKLAEALKQNFWAYDASKALFEDVIGFPDPSSLCSGEIRYVPTPLSIWGKEFLLIDELSRATPSMQNKWLEIIRSRQIMGMKLPELRYIFAAMNPTTYSGTHELDEALAGRFAVIATVPDAQQMSDADIRRIITNQTDEDAPEISFKGTGVAQGKKNTNGSITEENNLDLNQFLASCRNKLLAIPDEFKQQLALYISEIGRFFQGRQISIDGRRLGMMWRNIQACTVVEAEFAGKTVSSVDRENRNIQKAVGHLLPFSAIGKGSSIPFIRIAHEAGMNAALGKENKRVFHMPENPHEALSLFNKKCEELTDVERSAALTSFISNAFKKGSTEKRLPYIMVFASLANAVTTGRLSLSADDQYRALEKYRNMTNLSNSCACDAAEALDYTETVCPDISPELTKSLFPFRVAYIWGQEAARRSRGADKEQVAQITKQAVEQWLIMKGEF